MTQTVPDISFTLDAYASRPVACLCEVPNLSLDACLQASGILRGGAIKAAVADLFNVHMREGGRSFYLFNVHMREGGRSFYFQHNTFEKNTK